MTGSPQNLRGRARNPIRAVSVLVAGPPPKRVPLPPAADVKRLALEIRLIPLEHRADAVQVAWLAHLEGLAVATAVNTWWTRERRRRKRERTNHHGA